MCMLCLVYLPFLAMQIADLQSNIVIGDCSGTTSVSLFKNQLFSILECARAITSVNSELY